MRDAADPGTETSPAAALVGRERELVALRACLGAALAGRGRLVLIGGAAGIGKTALAEALCAEAAERGALVLVGRCYDLSETPPYGPWAEAFARAPRAGDLPQSPDLAGGTGAASQAALFAQVRDYLGALAARRPLVMLLDDLHWADPASRDLLRVVARGLGDTPLLLLATYRADELTRRHPLNQLLPTVVREARAERLDLRPLDGAALGALAAGRYPLGTGDAARLVAYLRDRSEGNPFFAGELLRALEEEGALRREGEGWALGDLAAAGVPPLLRQVLDARVDRLGEEVRDLLAVAAVLGQEAPLDLWGAVAGAGEGELLAAAERAEEARLLAGAPGVAGVRFAHALIREALYEGTLGPRRRALHRRAGEALLAGPAPSPDAVAYHFQRAGDDRASEWLLRAGERAQRAYAWLTAAARFEAALALTGGGAAAGARGWLLYRLARMRRYADPHRGLADLDEAARAAADAGDGALAALVSINQGLLRYYVGALSMGLADMAAGIAALAALPAGARERCRAVASACGDSPDAEEQRGSLVNGLAEAGRYAEARALGEEVAARAPAPAAGREAGGSGYGDAYHGLGRTYAALGRPAEAQAAWARARAHFRAVDHRAALAATAVAELLEVAWPYRADDPAARLAAQADAATALARGREVLGGAGDLLGALLLALEGRWGEARPPLLAAWGGGGAAPWRALAAEALGPLLLARGDAALTWTLVREVLPQGPATAPGDSAYLLSLGVQRLAAALALDAGDLPTTRAWLECHDRWLAWAGIVLDRAEGALGWAEYYRAAGDLAAARQYAETALSHASEPRQPLALLAARRTLGELATAAGHHADAATHLADALALADACAAPYERALSLLALAELQVATGEREARGDDGPAAAALLAEARAILEPLEARPALAHAAALAARLAAPPAPPAALPFGLSAREAAVLRLVVAGLTNPQVAARLFVTPRTVNAHLTAVYTKLGVAGRAAAIRVALEHGFA